MSVEGGPGKNEKKGARKFLNTVMAGVVASGLSAAPETAEAKRPPAPEPPPVTLEQPEAVRPPDQRVDMEILYANVQSVMDANNDMMEHINKLELSAIEESMTSLERAVPKLARPRSEYRALHEQVKMLKETAGNYSTAAQALFLTVKGMRAEAAKGKTVTPETIAAVLRQFGDVQNLSGQMQYLYAAVASDPLVTSSFKI